MTQIESARKRQLLETAFSPSSPIRSSEFFLGRYEQLERACDAINNRGQHLVIHGERGVGKTSFANIVETKLSNVTASKVTCSSDDDFRRIWTRALRRIEFVRDAHGFGFSAAPREERLQLDFFLPENCDIECDHVQVALERVGGNLLFIFDEFDTVKDDETRRKLAQTMKALSDNAPGVTIAVVGVSGDVASLIGHHSSIERCIKQIQMPRMSRAELGEVIDKGCGMLQLGIEGAVRERIITFSSGFPHFTHLLTKFAAREALGKDGAAILDEDYRGALEYALEDVSQSIRDAYQQATLDVKRKASKFSAVVAAAALAQEDEYGTFSISDLVRPYSKITGRKVEARHLTYNVQRLCDENRGAVLSKLGDVSTKVRFRFTNPLMKVYVRMRLDKERGSKQPQLFAE